MGTRSVTIVKDEDNKELVRIYRQYDGYPDGHGVELAKLCDRMLTNGISCGSKEPYVTSNGMRELAAQLVCWLKNDSPMGNIYLEPPRGKICDWAEYVYTVRGKEGQKPIIECRTHVDSDGPNIFNPKTTEQLVFKGCPQEWLAKYAKEEVA